MSKGNIEHRDTALDVIRVVAIFFVLFTHTGDRGSKIYTLLDSQDLYYYFCLSLDVIRMISVPLFMMLSGALLLGREISLSKLFKKYLFRIVLALVIFSLIQYWWNMYAYGWKICEEKQILKYIYTGSLRGEYWYLYLYLAYLCLIPFLHPIAISLNRKNLIYLLLLSTAVDIIAVISYQDGSFYSQFYSHIYVVNEYAVLYPLLGFGAVNYLKEHKLSIKGYILCFVLFIFVVCFCSYMVYYEWKNTGTYTEAHIWRFTAMLSMPVFMMLYDLTNRIQFHVASKLVFKCISESCFLIYLCENIFKKYTNGVYSFVYSITNGKILVSTFCQLITVIFVGTIIGTVLKRVPIIRKIL